MSMLSAQCDELRAMAESVGLAMPQAATLMMDAADTIWELRCRLVDAENRVRKLGELCKLCEREDENAKLREDRDTYRDLVGCMVHPDIPDQLASENAKLRELVADVHESLRADKAGMFHRLILASMEDDMRELGIEDNDG